MGRSKIGGRDLSGSFISLQRLIGRDLTLVAKSEFSEVAMIVSLPITQFLAKHWTGGWVVRAHLVIEDL